MTPDGKLSILVLFPRYYWEHKMSPVRRDVIRELLKHSQHSEPQSRECGIPAYECKLSGIGWDDYDPRLSVQENVEQLAPHCDAIFTYKPLGTREVPPLKDFAKAEPLKVEAWNECWHPQQAMMVAAAEAGIQLAILHHANDAVHWKGCEDYGIKTVHIPHCAAPIYFDCCRPWRERDIPVVLTGVLSAEYYPLRCRLARLIRQGKIPGRIHSHPGYRLKNVEECDKQQRSYAELLGRSKLVLGCTSKFRYRLARITEIAAAGATCVSDLPDQDPIEHTRFIWPISSEMSDDELVAAVREAIEQEDAAKGLAEAGRGIMQARYRQVHYVSRLLRAIVERRRELGMS